MASSREAFLKKAIVVPIPAPPADTVVDDKVDNGPTNRKFHKILENVYKPGFIDTKDPETMKMSIDRELGELSKALFKTSERDANNITNISLLQLQNGDLDAKIKDVQHLSTEGDAALAQQIHTLETNFGDVDGKINAAVKVEETARTTADTALGQRITTVQSNLDTASAKITAETTARTTADTALGQRIDTVHAEIGTATGTITQEMTVKIDAVDTKATNAGTAAATADGKAVAAQTAATTANTAATTAHTLAQSAMTKATGIEAHWGITVAAGNKISGISLLNNSATSSFAILADHFIVSDGTHDTIPFEIVGGVTKIKNASVGDIHSDNWNSTTNTGWSIQKNGNATFNNVTVRGHVEASSGSFTGAVTATSGSFTGAVHASSGEFTGTVHANAGTFNNVTIAENCTILGTVNAKNITGDIIRIDYVSVPNKANDRIYGSGEQVTMYTLHFPAVDFVQTLYIPKCSHGQVVDYENAGHFTMYIKANNGAAQVIRQGDPSTGNIWPSSYDNLKMDVPAGATSVSIYYQGDRKSEWHRSLDSTTATNHDLIYMFKKAGNMSIT